MDLSDYNGPYSGNEWGVVFPSENQLYKTDPLIDNELPAERDISYSDNEHDTSAKSYNEDELDSLFFPPAEHVESPDNSNMDLPDYNGLYTGNEWGVLSSSESQLSKPDPLIDNELPAERDIPYSDSEHDTSFKSYNEDELNSLFFPHAGHVETPDNSNMVLSDYNQQVSEISFRTAFVESSTPLKNKQKIDSSFNEEDWKSFLHEKANEDEEMFDIDTSVEDENDSEMNNSFNVVEKSNVAAIDPEFYGEVYAVPQRCIQSRGM